MKKVICLLSVMAIFVIGGFSVNADVKTQEENGISSEILNNNKVKDSDTLLKISGDVYIHGKATIIENNEVIASLDSDNNPDAKSIRELKSGSNLKTVNINLKSADRATPPVQVIKLGVQSYAEGVWDVNAGLPLHYTQYAYETTNPSVDLLYWESFRDSMYIGGSEVWNSPTSGTVVYGGQGTYIRPLYNSSAVWTYSPFVAGASWYVGNI
ncbi:hypothetical protein [Lactococcus lactis]